MIVAGALLLDRVANFPSSSLSALAFEQLFPAFVDEVRRFSSQQDDVCMVAVERQAAERGHPSPHQSAFPRVDGGQSRSVPIPAVV